MIGIFCGQDVGEEAFICRTPGRRGSNDKRDKMPGLSRLPGPLQFLPPVLELIVPNGIITAQGRADFTAQTPC